MPIVGLLSRQAELCERVRLAEGWHPSGAAEGRLFDVTCQVLSAARELERTTAAPGAAAATPAVVGALNAAFEALANAVLGIRAGAIAELQAQAQDGGKLDELEALGRLLFAADQNLRFAADASARSREKAAAIAEAPGEATGD